MIRYNQPYIEHQFRNPGEWADGMKKWFAYMFETVSIEDILKISKVVQDLWRWDAQLVTAKDSVAFFKTFTPGVTGMPTDTVTPPTDEHMGVYGLVLSQGVQAILGLTPWSNGLTDPALLNAKLTVKVNGDTKINSMPLDEAIDGLTDRGVGFVPLTSMFAWQGDTTIEVRVDFQGGQVAIASTNLRIKLVGFGFGA